MDMKITLENENGIYSVELKEAPIHIDDIKEDVLKPLLYVIGFQPETVARLFGELEYKVEANLGDPLTDVGKGAFTVPPTLDELNEREYKRKKNDD
jgi:hypothetical protein